MTPTVLQRGNSFYLKLEIPTHLRPILGIKQLWKALKTTSKPLARVMGHQLALEASRYLSGHPMSLDLDVLKTLLEAGVTHFRISESGFNKWTDHEFFNKSKALGRLQIQDVTYGETNARRYLNVPLQGLTNALERDIKAKEEALKVQTYPVLSKLIQNYIDSKRNVEEKTLNSYKEAFSLLLGFLGDIRADQLDMDKAEEFYSCLKQQPINANKYPKLKNLSMSARADYAKAQNLETISDTTIEKHLNRVKALFELGINSRHFQKNPFKHITHTSESVKIQPFTENELSILFSQFRPRNKDYLWIPQIALYSGLRLEEICQLDKSDLMQIDGCWCFSVNASGSQKSLKTKQSERIVPVHSKLIEIGLIELLKCNKANPKLFCSLKYTRSNKWGGAVQKSFSHFIKGLSLEGSKSFHSFRKNFNDALKNAGVDLEMRSELSGHRAPNLNSEVYTNQFRIEAKKEAVEKIRF